MKDLKIWTFFYFQFSTRGAEIFGGSASSY